MLQPTTWKKTLLCYNNNSKNLNNKLKTTLPLMKTKSMVESAWAENMGQSLYCLDPNTKKNTRSLKKRN